MLRLVSRAASRPGARSLYVTATSRPLCQKPAAQGVEPNTANFFTEEHYAIRDSVSKFVEAEINPNVEQWEAERQFPAHELFKKLGNAGFLGVSKDQAYGGLGLDFSYEAAAQEALGNTNCMGITLAIGIQCCMATPGVAKRANDEIRRNWLAPAIAGDMVACLGVSEPAAGSDVAGLRTTAVKKGGDYVINGSKLWITNSFQADWMCLLANTGTGDLHRNKSLILLPMDTPGIILNRKLDKLGHHCSDTGEIYFEDVRVPQSHLIGEEGKGFMYQMETFQEERLFAALHVLAPLQKVIDQTIEYTSQRMAYGKPLLSNQVIHFRLAELQTELELLRSLTYRAIAKMIQGEDVTYLASMAKLKAGRLGRVITDSCLQFWGGMGYTTEVLVSRYYREMRLISIGGGADEVMLGILSKYMGTLPPVETRTTK